MSTNMLKKTARFTLALKADNLPPKPQKKARRNKLTKIREGYASLRVKMAGTAKSIRDLYKGIEKDINALRTKLIAAQKKFASAGCKGKFSKWLKDDVGIPRSTAYYVIHGSYESGGKKLSNIQRQLQFLGLTKAKTPAEIDRVLLNIRQAALNLLISRADEVAAKVQATHKLTDEQTKEFATMTKGFYEKVAAKVNGKSQKKPVHSVPSTTRLAATHVAAQA